ncbi:MAG TPA: exonuclease domain-containing protein [Hyphomicrobiaceae bacterium]|jgi:DNA polymerase III epsilon subunit-like protein
MTVRVIDIETTGIDPTVDAIIEIASVDLLKDGAIANQRTALVRPPLPVLRVERRASPDRRGPRLRAGA